MFHYGPGPRARPVFEALRASILSGECSAGERLPSQAELAASFGVAPLTLRQAIAYLEQEGLVSSEQGRGTFVRATVADPPSAAAMIAASPAPVISFTPDAVVSSWNAAAERMLGWSAAEVVGRPVPGISDEFRLQLEEMFQRVVAGETLTNVERRRLRKDGALIDVSIDIAPTRDASGLVTGVVAIFTDITARKRAERALVEAEQRFRATFDKAGVGIAHTDLEGRWLLINQQLCDLYGRTREELMQLRFQDITYPDDLPADLEHLQRLLRGETSSYALRKRYIRGDGSIIWANLTVSMVRDQQENPHYIIAVVQDITDRVRAEEQLAHQALHDPLTELPNRNLLNDRLQQAILSGQREMRSVALLLMDLDRFKDINDTYGHQYGDQVLKQLGSRLAPLLRRSDTIGRLGGDEFAIILPGTNDAGARQTARRLLKALEEPFVFGGQRFHIGGSVGIAVYPRHGADAGALLRRADVAMYVAKRLGSGCVVYSADQDQYSHDRLSLITDLRRAIEEGELSLYYQPKIYLKTGEIEGFEALVRWRHPERGLVDPDRFIPLAEHSGLIKPLTLWVLKQALAQCRAWNDTGLDFSIAVNLSPRNLLDADIIETVISSLQRSGVRPEQLQIELTEGALMSDPARARDVLNQLHETGIGIIIDDFGTGYSSLAHLKRLPVDQFKIDRSFVLDMLNNDNDRSIVRATVGLGHDLGMKTVAEGVESQEVCEALACLGCDLAQGYYVSRPLPAVECAQWVQVRRRKVA